MYFVAEDIYETPLRHLAPDLKRVLDEPGSEEDTQRFLANHPEILARGFIRMTGFVVPKFRFGTEHISDFVVADWRQAWCISLLELEPKDAKAFNKDGTPAKRLSQAMKQLAEWTQWIERHNDYFIERLGEHVEQLISHLESTESRYGRFAHHLRRMHHPHATSVAIIGRRGDNFPEEQERRHSLHRFTGNNIEILSYDWLLDLIDDERETR